MTNREQADKVLTMLRLTSKDRYISRRLVLSVLWEKMTYLLSQKLRDRTLYREENLYKTIDCVEFEPVRGHSCDIVEFRNCKKLMRSKKPLKGLIYSRYGSSIRMVTNLDSTIRLERTTPADYIRNVRRKGYKPEPAFYEKEGYIYLLETTMERGIIDLMTINLKEAEKLDSCHKKQNCKSILDYEFVGSDKLREIAVQEAYKEITSLYLSIQPDENPDNNENRI